MRFRRFIATFMASAFVATSCVPMAHADWEDVVHKHVVVPFTDLFVHGIQALGDIVQAGGSEIRDIVIDDYEFWTQWIRDESLEYREFVSTLSATNVSHDGLFEIYPGGWTMGANKWMNPSNIQSYAGGYDWEGYVLEDPDDGTWEWFGVCAQAFSLPAGVYKLWFDDYYGDVAMSWSSIYYGRIPLYLDVCVDGVWSRPATVDFSEYSDDFPKSVTFTVPAGGYPTCVMRTDPNLQDGGGYRDYDGGEKIKFGFAGHIEAIELAESGSIPESTTRTSSLMQALDAYNAGNSYVDNSTTVNYFIGSLGSDGSVSNVYSPALYDEETLIFTEPVTGTQYQTTGWKYDYNTRAYDLALASGTFTMDGSNITRILLTYGDDDLAIKYYAGSTLVKTDTYAYVMVSQSACNINGHTYTYEDVSIPTCTTPGERKYTCSVCGNEYVEEILATGGHAYEYSIYQAATCTAAGIGLYTCSSCGDQYTEPISAIGHTDKLIQYVPTEYDDNGLVITTGYSVYECQACGIQYTVVDEIPIEAESWFSWLGSQFKTLISSLVNGLASGLEYLFKTVIGTLTDWIIKLTEWVFGLFDGDSLTAWFDWFSEDNATLNNDFAVSGAASEVDVWVYS